MTRLQRTILAVATLTQAVALGVTVGVFPLFMEPLERDFEAPRTLISLGPVLLMFSLAGAGVVAGGVLDRGEVRKAMLFGAGLLTTGLATAAVAPNLVVLGVAAVCCGISIPFLGPLAGMTLVTRIFDADQGRAFGIMSMGPALGSGFFAGLAGLLLQTATWREIYGLLAGVTAVVLVPTLLWTIPARVAPSQTSAGAEGAEVELGEVLRRPVFWWSALVFALSAGLATGWTNHVGAFLSGSGLTEPQVASLVATQFWMGAPGALAFGVLSDRLPLTGLYLGMLVFEGLAFAIYAAGITLLGAWMLAVSFGFVIGGLIPLYMALIGRRLEPQVLGRAMGISNLVMLPALAVAAILAATIYERDGDYDVALWVFAFAMLGAIVALLQSNRRAAG